MPYLARRVALERLRQTFHYEVTKAGVVYVLVTLVIGIAALNTGNNLLYIVVAAMLAAILVSGVVSAMVLRGLELEVRLARARFCRACGGGTDCAAQSAAIFALVFDSGGYQHARKRRPARSGGGSRRHLFFR